MYYNVKNVFSDIEDVQQEAGEFLVNIFKNLPTDVYVTGINWITERTA